MGNRKDVPCAVPKPGAVSVQMSWQQVTDHVERDSDDLRKAKKGAKAVRSGECPASLLDGERGNKETLARRTRRGSPRHHIQTVYPERCQGVRSQGVHRCASSIVIAAYVEKAKISLAISGTAPNFALAVQGTVQTANSPGEAGEAVGRELAEAPRHCHPHRQPYPGWLEKSWLR